jgi:hypothetical protein
MVYGDGFASADDVVAHEMTHGVTEHESNLIYLNQSGAINESFSDIWGEFVDLTNSKGNDDLSVKWQMGEDLPPEIGVIRDMSDPTAVGSPPSPDRMLSPYYWNHQCDNGGVHFNSGIGNKAAYLMTDGGSFNGKTITGIGITKVAKIFYEAQSHLLTTASDYNDLADALQQACAILTGTDGITGSDCQEVVNAIIATEMNQIPPANVLKNPGFESGRLYWTQHSSGGYNVITTFPYFGFCSTDGFVWFGDYDNAEEDIYQNVNIPSNAAEVYLRFAYAIFTEEWEGTPYDTMKIEVWNSGGTTLLSTLDTLSNVNDTFGYWDFSPKYDLTPYKGQTVRLRFHVTTNGANISDFFLDDIVLVSVVLPETVSTPSTPSGPTSGAVLTPYTFSTGASSSSYGDSVQYLFDWGDGTNSGWLPANVSSKSKSWTNPGTYLVKVQARCTTHTSARSSWSQEFLIDIVPIVISLQSPADVSVFNSCSLISNYQPPFQWTANGTLKTYTILISTSPADFTTTGILINKASVSGTYLTWKPSSFVWKKVLQSSYNLGTIRDTYWKVVGTKSDGTFVETAVRSFRIGDTQSVTINTPGEGDTLFTTIPPTFNFDTNCNKKFTLQFSPLIDFSDSTKIKAVTITITNPNVQTTVQKTLSSFQWSGIVKLLGTGGYFRIKAWDALNRLTTEGPRAFSIN